MIIVLRILVNCHSLKTFIHSEKKMVLFDNWVLPPRLHEAVVPDVVPPTVVAPTVVSPPTVVPIVVAP